MPKHTHVVKQLDGHLDSDASTFWLRQVWQGTRKLRLFWIPVVFAIFFGMIFHVTKNTTEYRKEATSSEYNPWVPSAFPNILYCNPYYWNWTAIAELGWTEEQVYFLDAFFPFGVTGSALSRLSVTEYNLKYPNANDIYLQVVKSVMHYEALTALLLEKNLTFEGLLEQITYAPEARVDVQFGMVGQDHNIRMERRLTMYGICAYLDFSSLQLSELETQLGTIRMTLLNQPTQPYAYHYLFVGGQSGSVIPSAKAMLAVGKSYLLKIQGDQTERVDTKRMPCRAYSEAERSQCIAQCFNSEICNEECQNAVPGYMYPTERLKEHCNYLLDFMLSRTSCMAKIMAFANLTEVCYDRCPSLCSEHKYQVTIRPFVSSADASSTEDVGTTVGPPENVTALGNITAFGNITASQSITTSAPAISDETSNPVIYITFSNPMQGFEVKQVISVPLDTFLSNLGGTIALWSGASVVTIAQIISLCTLKKNK